MSVIDVYSLGNGSSGYPSGINQDTYALLLGLGKAISVMDEGLQQVHGAARLQSSTGAQIDSWAYDFFGGTFQRFAQYGETDAQWISRIITILSTPKGTQPGVQAIVNVFWPWIKLQFGAQTLAEDTGLGGEDATGGEDVAVSATFGSSGGFASSGLAVGENTYGGLDTGLTFEDVTGAGNLPPIPIIFDAQTNPTLANLITPKIVPPYFGVYVQFPGANDNLIHPIVSPSAILTSLIAAIKCTGTIPVFCANR